jgi:zinc transporter 9
MSKLDQHRGLTPKGQKVLECDNNQNNQNGEGKNHPSMNRTRIQKKLQSELETTMPLFQKQLTSFTAQLKQKHALDQGDNKHNFVHTTTTKTTPSTRSELEMGEKSTTNHLSNSSMHNSTPSTRQKLSKRTVSTPTRAHSTIQRPKLLKNKKNKNNKRNNTKLKSPLTSTSSKPYSSNNPPHHDDHQQQQYRKAQPILTIINKISRILSPKIKKLVSLVKTGTITLTGPLINIMKDKLIPPLSVAGNKLSHQGEALLLWVDKQIAKRENIPVDQISAIRTQVIAITANSIVAVSKAVAAYFSNSGVMLAEALHSLADLSNQALLLFGTTKALRDSDDIHPYGYATAKYIYGVLSASGVFFISCALTMYHAITQYFDDSHVVAVTPLTVVVLALSFIVEGYSQYAAYKSIKELAAKDEMTFMQYIRHGKETTSIAIFVEDSIAIVGLLIAIVTTALTHIYQNNIYDTIGTGCIGLAMGFVSYFLFHRNESYVLGASFSNEEKNEIVDALKAREAVIAVHDLKAVHYGESDCRVKAEVVFNGHIIAKQVLDQTKLIPVTVPFKDQANNNTLTQSMLIGPDGTLAGNQILYHLTKNAGLSSDDATSLLLRFGGECVSEVARETDQVEKFTKSQFPQVTHLDLECHSSNPLDDFTSENFLYPYLENHRKGKELVASAKRAKKSRAWTNEARTTFSSLSQAMRGELQQHQFQHPRDQSPQTTVLGSSLGGPIPTQNTGIKSQPPLPPHKHQHVIGSAPSHLTPSPIYPPPTPPNTHIKLATSQTQLDALDELTKTINLEQHTLPTSQVFHDVSQITNTKARLRYGRYDKPVSAKELVDNDVYKEVLMTYKKTFGDIDSSMTLFPLDAYNELQKGVVREDDIGGEQQQGKK